MRSTVLAFRTIISRNAVLSLSMAQVSVTSDDANGITTSGLQEIEQTCETIYWYAWILKFLLLMVPAHFTKEIEHE